MPKSCDMCKDAGTVSTAYDRWFAPCPRCQGGQVGREVHTSLLLRNRRSGKVWAVFARYPDDWGLHRMKPSRRTGSHYVWQIIHRTEDELTDRSRWVPAGYGDAWEHDKMESDPLALCQTWSDA